MQTGRYMASGYYLIALYSVVAAFWRRGRLPHVKTRAETGRLPTELNTRCLGGSLWRSRCIWPRIYSSVD